MIDNKKELLTKLENFENNFKQFKTSFLKQLESKEETKFKIGDKIVIKNIEDYNEKLRGRVAIIKSYYDLQDYFVIEWCDDPLDELQTRGWNSEELELFFEKQEIFDIPENIHINIFNDCKSILFNNDTQRLSIFNRNFCVLNKYSENNISFINNSKELCLIPVKLEEIKEGDIFVPKDFMDFLYQYNIVDKNLMAFCVFDYRRIEGGEAEKIAFYTEFGTGFKNVELLKVVKRSDLK
jgi:hypothetical protein